MSGTLHGPDGAATALPRGTGATGPVTAGRGQREDTVPGLQPGRAEGVPEGAEPYGCGPVPCGPAGGGPYRPPPACG
ncbi:PE-PGRS family protein, partial [Kitasatospora sp. NPDC056783]